MAVKRKTSEIPTNQTEPSTPTQENVFEWTQMKEIKLFEALLIHKPAGIAKHFNMALIYHRLSQQEGFKNLNSQNIWDHLENFFNLEKADFVERSFLDPEISDEVEFKLPRDFAEAITVMNKEYLLVESVVKKADKTQELTKKTEKTAAEAGTSKKPEKSSEGLTKKPDKISTPVVSGTDENAEKDVTESGELETPKTGNKRATPRSAPSNSAKRRK